MKHIFLILFVIIVISSCKEETNRSLNQSHDDDHPHAHNSYVSDVPAHKLIFPSKVPDRVIVNLTEDAQHSFAVNWRTDPSISTAYVEVAKESHGPDFLIDGSITKSMAESERISVENTRDEEPLVEAKYHSALIENLEAGTTYVYRVGDGSDNDDLWSEWFQIQTAPENKDEPFSFIYFGDAQNNVKSMWSRVIRKSYKMLPEVNFMLHAGDLINHSESDREWGEWFYAGSFIHATVPSVMTPGNHEYNRETERSKLSALWRPQFNLPKNGPSEDLMETCYVIDYQNMKLISIDSQSLDNDPVSRELQEKWLDSVLASNTQKWTTITMHHPIYSTAKGRDNTALRETLKPLIDKYKVDLVLQGHDHTYARGYDSNADSGKTVVEDAGAVYAVSVSGPKMYESEAQTWMEKRGEFTQLFQIITVANDTLKYNAYTPLGGLFDSFQIVKKDGNKTIINNAESKAFTRFKKDFVSEE
ncbi:metallophosphoesterase family protein [Formosa sp. PL04]|uniref:metallophosphoesterase family protein n=1 Tax=Formosa sp. PL04 TaxID=3081755 RepID=UPI002982A040|nr:metallophosphoesterase family protein [Formosa sp. PL04]MDW5290902.1 metallophosphoesterase family protein [Formosa sp. PL04]